MAGGPHAAIVPCLRCAGPAHRTGEGLETDWYECADCGYTLGIDWDAGGGPPESLRWPPTEEEVAEIKRVAALFGKQAKEVELPPLSLDPPRKSFWKRLFGRGD